jgi:hypothetical protein
MFFRYVTLAKLDVAVRPQACRHGVEAVWLAHSEMHRMVYGVDVYRGCKSAASSSLRCVLQGCGDQANVVLGLLVLEQMETVEVAPDEAARGEVGVSRQCAAWDITWRVLWPSLVVVVCLVLRERTFGVERFGISLLRTY